MIAHTASGIQFRRDTASYCVFYIGHDRSITTRAISPVTGEKLMHFLLIYELSADYLERRAAFRDRHLTVAWASAARGELLLGGALDAPVDRAMLLFEADS